MNVLDWIQDNPIIAIVRLDDLSASVDLSKALCDGGVNTIEFTLTNPDATGAISKVRDVLGDRVCVGAGSVITARQVQEVMDSGAQFVVSPVTKRRVIETCHTHDIPTIPGAYTPSEIQVAWEMDVAAVKVFPARNLGASYIKDVLAPLPHLRLIPTGGINVDNITSFKKAGVFAVGVGGALCNPVTIANCDWDVITANAKSLIEACR